MDISTHQLQRKLASREPPLLLDVRERDEYQDWHIPEALNMPMSEFLSLSISLPHDREIITICQHGSRSAQATEYLRQQGLSKVVTLAGGMVEWNGVYDVGVVVERNESTIYQFRRLGKGCLSYLLESDGKALVIDPTVDIDEYLKLVKEKKLDLIGVADTHAHADHISGSRLLAEKAIVPYFAPDEVGGVTHETLTSGSKLVVGKIDLRMLAAPGHTSGSLLFRAGKYVHDLLTGDTLFVDGVGRPDLGQDTKVSAYQLHNTLHETIFELAPNTTILPAHVGDRVKVTLGKRVSASMHTIQERLSAIFNLDENGFAQWIGKNDLPKPPNFETIKQINIGKLALPSLADIRELEAGPNRCDIT